MSSMTASIVLGILHPNDDIIPQHFLEVREGSRISLVLHPLDHNQLTRSWEVPAPSQLPVSGLALIAIAGDRVPKHHLSYREHVNGDELTAKVLDELSIATAEWDQLALVVTVLDASSLRADAFVELPQANIQVCVEVYRRHWTSWQEAWHVESRKVDDRMMFDTKKEGEDQ